MSSPSFVPGNSSPWYTAASPAPSPRVRRKSRVVPVARPANPPAPVNLRIVGLAGTVAWLGVIGLVIGAWVMSGHAKPQVVAVAPAPQETALPATQSTEKPAEEPKAIGNRDIPVPAAKAPLAATPPAKAAPVPVLDKKQLENAEAAVAAQFIDPAPAPAAKPADPAPKAEEENGNKCGTAVAFLDEPSQAMKKAREDQKLVFLVHVAGDFEDPGFT